MCDLSTNNFKYVVCLSLFPWKIWPFTKDERNIQEIEYPLNILQKLYSMATLQTKTILEISQLKIHLFILLQKWKEYCNDVPYVRHPYSIIINSSYSCFTMFFLFASFLLSIISF